MSVEGIFWTNLTLRINKRSWPPQKQNCNVLLDTQVKDNNLRGEQLSNQKIQDAVSDVIEETEAGFEHNYNESKCDTSYQSPILKKDVLTIND